MKKELLFDFVTIIIIVVIVIIVIFFIIVKMDISLFFSL